MQAANLAQNSVYPVTNTQKKLLWFKVNIGRILLNRIGQNRVHQTHQWLAIFIRSRFSALLSDFAGFNLVQNSVDRQFKTVILINRFINI